MLMRTFVDLSLTLVVVASSFRGETMALFVFRHAHGFNMLGDTCIWRWIEESVDHGVSFQF